MILYKLSNKAGDMVQWVAHYDDEYILCIDFTDGELDTYNVLEIEDFEGILTADKKIRKMPQDICILFLKFLFIKGFDGGDGSDIT